MSVSRHNVSDNQASASENESERLTSAKQQPAVNHTKVSHPVTEEVVTPPNTKKQSLSTLQLPQSDGVIQDTSLNDGPAVRNNPGISSEKDQGCNDTVDMNSVQSLPPSIPLNTTCEKGDQDSLGPLESSCSPNSVDGSFYLDNVSRSSESGKSIDLGLPKSLELQISKSDISKSDKSKKEKKKASWYNMLLNPTYKSRSEDFKRLFKDLPDSERLITDYSCALQKDILVHGRLYVSQNYICFYANIFRWETLLCIQFRDVTSMTKEKTARVIPNAIQITTDTEKHFFTSFGAREKSFVMLFRIWQNALLEQPMSSQELWQWVHFIYGRELGLTSDDDDYVAPPDDEGKYAKFSEASFEKEGLLPDLANECLPLDQNSESANGAEEDLEAGEEPSLLPPSVKTQDYPTDMSDSTESVENVEDGESKCPCTEHEGKEVLNAIFPLPVDQAFSLIFTGSKFYNDLLESRKTYDILESPWQLCPEFDLKMRQVTYTLTLNHSMAKSAQTTETQRLLKHSKPGQVYTVDCDVVNTGIPYSDAFTVKSVYCLTKVSKRDCRLRISGCVRYKKNVWGLVRSLIEKSAMQGLADFATDLASALQKEAELSSQQNSKKPRRRKRMKFDSIKCETLKDAPRILQRQPTIRNIGSSISGIDFVSLGTTPDIVIRVILITLIILLFLNMLLFYKLWSLEDQSTKQIPLVTPDYADSMSSLSREDYLQILQKQDALHRSETDRWRDALGEVIKLVHLIEKSLSELKSNIDSYSSSSILKAIALRMSQAAKEASTEEDSAAT